jgi:uridine kinase
MFADELAQALRADGRAVVRVSADDFHHVRALRYRRGRDSSDGFWLDSHDYDRLRADVLHPLGPGGDRRYRPAAHDLATDEITHPPWRIADPGAVLVLDGLFLHRDELAGCWDFSVFLLVPFAETARRLADRDGTPADPVHPRLRRYVEAHRIYLATCSPTTRASLVIDNTDLAAPHLLG